MRPFILAAAAGAGLSVIANNGFPKAVGFGPVLCRCLERDCSASRTIIAYGTIPPMSVESPWRPEEWNAKVMIVGKMKPLR
jgi:hypothetical protein